MESLPEVAIIEILQRVESVKSIGQFRCVSKAWRSLLSTPQFAKSHLQFNIHGPQNIFLFDDIYSPYIGSFTTEHGGNHRLTYKEANFEPLDHRKNGVIYSELHFHVHDSCHGLVLLGTGARKGREYEEILVLLNPTTLEAADIPPHGHNGYALGYDSCADDYKIVAVETDFLDIYSVRTKTWRTLQHSPPKYATTSSGFVSGRLNFLSQDEESAGGGWPKRRCLWAFNLATEEFETVPLPRGFDRTYSGSRGVGGYLAMVVQSESGGREDVWLMKDYGVQDSWTKFTIYNSYYADYRWTCPVCFLSEDVIVLPIERKKIVAYNLKTGERKDVMVDAPLGMTHGGLCFRESLISPNYS